MLECWRAERDKLTSFWVEFSGCFKLPNFVSVCYVHPINPSSPQTLDHLHFLQKLPRMSVSPSAWCWRCWRELECRWRLDRCWNPPYLAEGARLSKTHSKAKRSWGWKFETTTIVGKITPARDPKQCGDRKSVPDTSNSSYGTVTDQIRHYRNCSRKNLFWHKKQRYVYSSGPPTRNSYQDISENFKRSSKKDFLYRGSLEDLHTRNSYEHPRRTLPAPMQSIFLRRISTGSHKIFSQGPVQDHVRTCTGFHGDLFKIFSQGPAQDHAKASVSMSLGSP